MQWLLAWVATASVIAFAAAVIDKARARARPMGRRVREATLLGLAFVGGSPGLVLAMLVARHMVRKGSFLAKLAAIVALQCAAVLWWYGARAGLGRGA